MPKTIPNPVQVYEVTHKGIDNIRVHFPIVPGNPDYTVDPAMAFAEGTGLHYTGFVGDIVGNEVVRVEWAAMPQNIRDALQDLHNYLENQLTDI